MPILSLQNVSKDYATDGQPVRLVQEVTVHVYNDEREDTGLHLTK